MYLKEPTILYHAELAPLGRRFNGDPERPVPHPGKGWVDSPADLPKPTKAPGADEVVGANARAKVAEDQNAQLQADLKTAIDRAEAAEKTAEDRLAALNAEKNDHAQTKAALDEAQNQVRVLDDRVQALEPEVAKIPGLTEQLAAANAESAELKKQLAKFDRDGDGRVGGGPKKAAG
jgi:hypothetical protein